MSPSLGKATNLGKDGYKDGEGWSSMTNIPVCAV